MPYFADLVEETSTTTGTGNVTLAGAIAQRQSFNAAFGTNKRFPYVILDGDATDWEQGIGYLSASDTLVRETVTASSNSGSSINLSSNTHKVFCDDIAFTVAKSGQGRSFAMTGYGMF